MDNYIEDLKTQLTELTSEIKALHEEDKKHIDKIEKNQTQLKHLTLGLLKLQKSNTKSQQLLSYLVALGAIGILSLSNVTDNFSPEVKKVLETMVTTVLLGGGSIAGLNTLRNSNDSDSSDRLINKLSYELDNN